MILVTIFAMDRKNVTNICIVNLAVADVFVVIVCLPMRVNIRTILLAGCIY